MKIGLRAGHSPNCTGAVGIVREHEQMMKYYNAVRTLLEQYGHTVIDCNSTGSTQNEELAEGARKCNTAGCGLFISLHMNSYDRNAHGTEVLVSNSNSTAYPYAKRLVDNFAELGFSKRGVKFENLYEMNHIKCGNIISEICFCDSQEDIDIYNKFSWDKLAHVLCNAIDPSIPKTSIIDDKQPTEKVYVVTQYLPGAYSDYDGVDISRVLSYFGDVKCFVRGNNKGVWIETCYISKSQAEKLKKDLGSWFYSIES